MDIEVKNGVLKIRISFVVQNWTFGCRFKIRLRFEHFLEIPTIIPAGVPMKVMSLQFNTNELDESP